MKSSRIKSSAFALASFLFVLTSCSDDAITPQVEPEYQSAYPTDFIDLRGENPHANSNSNSNSNSVYLRGEMKASVSQTWTAGHQHATDPETPNSRQSLGSEGESHATIIGQTTVYSDLLGELSLSMTFQSDSQNGTSVGKIELRSTDEAGGWMTLALQGNDRLTQNMVNAPGYSFDLTVIDASDSFTEVVREGFGVISSFDNYLRSAEEDVQIQFSIVLK